MILINDFAAAVQYSLDEKSRTVRKASLHYEPPAPGPEPARTEESFRTESLGRRTIGGVEAEGTRAVIIIPAGEAGNVSPAEIVAERWFSPGLQAVVLSRHSNRFVGETVYRLTDITRGEPAPTLFEVPAGYDIVAGEEPPSRPGRPR